MFSFPFLRLELQHSWSVGWSWWPTDQCPGSGGETGTSLLLMRRSSSLTPGSRSPMWGTSGPWSSGRSGSLTRGPTSVKSAQSIGKYHCMNEISHLIIKIAEADWLDRCDTTCEHPAWQRCPCADWQQRCLDMCCGPGHPRARSRGLD